MRGGFPWRVLLVLLCASCSYGAEADRRTDFVVLYAGQSIALDRQATTTIGRAAEAAKRTPSFGIVVAGFSDDPGSPEADQIQSRLRAQAVADALVQDGVKRDRIELTPRRALGGDPATESRRVDIRLAP